MKADNLDNLSICKICKISKQKKDFEIGEFKGTPNICWMCIYNKKRAKYEKDKPLCKICEKDLPPLRWTYCSEECLKKSKYLNPHWTRTVNYGNENWKERFIYPWKKK